MIIWRDSSCLICEDLGQLPVIDEAFCVKAEIQKIQNSEAHWEREAKWHIECVRSGQRLSLPKSLRVRVEPTALMIGGDRYQKRSFQTQVPYLNPLHGQQDEQVCRGCRSMISSVILTIAFQSIIPAYLMLRAVAARGIYESLTIHRLADAICFRNSDVVRESRYRLLCCNTNSRKNDGHNGAPAPVWPWDTGCGIFGQPKRYSRSCETHGI